MVGIHFAYISCCYVGQTSDKLCGRQEQPFVNRVCMKFEYITKVPYIDVPKICLLLLWKTKAAVSE